jgi:hypothetical protein
VIQFSLPSFVLCFGSDGHIAFEQYDDECRFDQPGEHKSHLESKHENLSHQNRDCEDIPLTNHFSSPFIEKDGKSKNFKLLTVTKFSHSQKAFPILQFKIDEDSAIILSQTKSLQTTVLII